MAKTRPKDYHEYLVPGLDVLISDPDLIEFKPDEEREAKCKRLLIPEFYLDRLKDFGKEYDYTARGRKSSVLISNINQIISLSSRSDDGCARFPNGMEAQVVSYRYDPSDQRFDPNSATQQTIKTAQYLLTGDGAREIGLPTDHKPLDKESLAVLTGDAFLSGKTLLRKIDVAFISHELYTGRRRLKLPIEASSLWCSNHRMTAKEFVEVFPYEPALKPQEFVEFYGDYHPLNNPRKFTTNIGRMDPEQNAIVPLRFQEISASGPKKVIPRTAGQAMMIEAMMLPCDEAPIIIALGALGTGKTYLSSAFSYYQGLVNAETPYDKIFIVPHDPALGADTGFLPGDATAKARANAMSYEDNMIEIIRHHYADGERLGDYGKAKKEFEDYIKDGLIGFDSIVRMGGRTLPNTIYFIDEAQDTERYQIKQLVGRTGDNSKVVVAGDPTQVTNRHLTPDNNGLVHAAAKLANHPNVVVVSFTVDEVTRSLAAQIAAKYL